MIEYLYKLFLQKELKDTLLAFLSGDKITIQIVDDVLHINRIG